MLCLASIKFLSMKLIYVYSDLRHAIPCSVIKAGSAGSHINACEHVTPVINDVDFSQTHQTCYAHLPRSSSSSLVVQTWYYILARW